MTKTTLFSIIISCAAWLPSSQLQAQCTNPLACNYDETATQDDGSCVYFDTDIFALGELMHTTTFVPNDACPGGLDLANSYAFPVVGTPDAPIGFTITPEQAASLIENLGSLGELFAYEVANASMSFCGTTITVDLQIAPDFTSEWSGDYYPFTSLNTFGVPSSIAGAGCNDPVACNYEPCAGPDPSMCTYPEAGFDCDGNASGCGDDEDQLTVSYDGLDGYPGEFTFTVVDESGMELGSGAGAGTFDICIPAGACVTVTLMDEYGDGQYGYGGLDGTTTVSLNGEVVETFTGNWGDSVTATAGGCPDGEGCGDDEDQLTVSYDGLDGYPIEFTFTVVDAAGMELGSGAGSGTFDFCIPAGACVTVMLMDEYGDGQYGWGAADGTTTVSLNGEVVETFTGNWGDSVTATAGGCPDVAGCTAELACNYNPQATEDDGSCVFSDATEFDVMDGFFLGFYDAESGCPNQVDLAGDLFYPVQLTENGYMFDVDEGLLGYLQFVLGPDLGLAFYNESVNNIFSVCDNQLNVTNSPLLGSITSPWTSPTFSIDFLGFNLYWYPASLATFGCTEETACNYDATPCIVPDATMCEYAAAGLDCDGNPLGGLTCDEGESLLAVNYDGADGWSEEFTFELTDGDGNVLGAGADAGFFEFCVPADACIVVTLNDSYGDGQNGGEFAPDGTTTVFYNGEVLESVTGDWGSSATILAGNCAASAGCMDAMACNYDATATEDDGSCVYFDTDIFALGEVMHTTTFVPNDDCPGGLDLANSYAFPVVGTPDAPIGFTITPEQAASLIENLGSLGELFAYEVANSSMSFCGTTITVDLQIAPDFTSEWSGDYYPFTSLNTFGVPSSIAGAGCNDPVACNYEPCAGPDPSLCTYPEAGFDCDGNASGCGDDEDLLTVSYDGLDGYPGEFTFTVVDDSGMELGSGAGAGTFDICIPAGACVTVTLMDEYGDGQYGWGEADGTTTVSLNGEVVETFTGDWGDSVTATAGDCSDGEGCGDDEDLLTVSYDGLDGYPGEFTFTVVDDSGMELGSGAGAGTFDICIPAGACVTVMLMDEYGDGQYGYGGLDGTTTVSLNGEVVETFTGDWGDSVTATAGDCSDGEGCGDDEDLLTVSYDGLDGYPSEFTFTVVDAAGMELGSGAGSGTFDICIPAGACVTVMLMDDYGDGQYGWGAADGTTTVSLNGEVMETFTGNWGSFASAPVGGCGIQCDEGQVGLEIFYDGADGYPEEYSFTVIDANGNELASGSDMGLFQFCLPDEACLIVLLEDSYGDGHQGYSGDPSGVTNISLNGELVESVTGNWGSSYAVAIGDCAAVAGCMDPESCNFDADALIDDGSCLSLDVCGVCGGPGLPDVFALDAVAILDEASMGDFSNDALNPTVVAFAGEGAYVLSGDAANFQTANADIEYFSMTVPAGYVISGVRMLAFDQTGYEPAGSPAGNGGFLGVGSGSTLPVIASPEDFVVAANALDGGALVGVMGGTTVGFGLLDDLAQPFEFPEYGINIDGISGSLTAGTYTFMFKEGNSHPETVNASVHWSFAIEVSATSTYHYMTIVDCDGCLNDADGDGVCDELEVAGCTDMSSCNYNPMATDDDGSCGDTPEAASLCGEGTEWSNETCGCVALPDNCPSDIDGDGITSTTDLLLLLQNFATDCQN